MSGLQFQKHPDGEGGYVVMEGTKILGTVWYAQDCLCWYTNRDPKASRPDRNLGSFGSKNLAAAALETK